MSIISYEIILLIFTITAVILLYRKAKQAEGYLSIKLFGYILLGAFMLDLNGLKLPLGFVVFLLFFRNIAVNAVVKKRAAYIGLLIFLLAVAMPFVETKLYEWPREVSLEDTNFFDGSMAAEWENIRNELGMTEKNPVFITNFETAFNQEGEMKRLRINLAEQAQSYMIFYTVKLAKDDKNVKVIRHKEKVEMRGESFYRSYSQAPVFFENIDLMPKQMINDKNITYYELRSEGQRARYNVRESKSFAVSTNGIERIESSQLPVEGIIVEGCGTRQVIDESDLRFECDTSAHYLLDMRQLQLEVNESNLLTVARKQSDEVDQWFNEHIGDYIGYEDDGEYTLKRDGVEETVTETEYVMALKQTPEIHTTYHEQTNLWSVTVKNPYGNEPHVMKFTLNGESHKVSDLTFR